MWTLTVANLGIPWVKGAVGAAGTGHPFFHMMDKFTGRSEYKTGIGKETQIVRATYPIHWRQFLEAVTEVSVTEYVVVSKDRALIDLRKTFTSSYHGNDGLLGFHRRKVFGFLAVSFRIGRSTTISGLGRKRRISSKKVFMSQLIKINSEGTGYWFLIEGSVYDASTFMQKHPGGDTVIALCSGQNITHSLKAAGHLTNGSTRSKLDTYRIGCLEKPKFHCSLTEEIYMAPIDLGQKAADTENVHRRNFQLLDGKLTMLDDPGVLTPKKARHLLDAKNRLQSEHVPALAMLLDALLDSIAKLDKILDQSSIRAEINKLLIPETKLCIAARYTDYAMAVNMLQNDLSLLTETKQLVAVVLGTLEDSGFRNYDKSGLDSIMSNLSSVASLLLLAGK